MEHKDTICQSVGLAPQREIEEIIFLLRETDTPKLTEPVAPRPEANSGACAGAGNSSVCARDSLRFFESPSDRSRMLSK